MKFLKPAAIYFVVVFTAGFLLAMIRIPFLVPRFGIRIAELFEIPVMLAIILVAAKWLVRTRLRGVLRRESLAVGIIAFGMLLGAEVTLGMIVSGRGPVEILLEKDPVSGTAYYLSLVIFAILPALISSSERKSRGTLIED